MGDAPNPSRNSMPSMNSMFNGYRPLWIALNITLIITTFFIWGNTNPHTIKVDLPNIKTQTTKLVKNDDTGKDLATKFGFKSRTTDGVDFCAWADTAAVKAKLKDPFNTLDCSKKHSISLDKFQAYDLHTFANPANTTVWDVYAYGEYGEDNGNLFADGAVLKEPADSIIDPYLKDDGIYLRPRICTTKYLKYLRDLTTAFGIIIIVYLLAHIAHWIGSLNKASDSNMQILDYIVLLMSVVTYVFAIVVYFVVDNGELFTKCAWISTWFQKDETMLYQIHLVYVVTGFIGLFFCIIHVIAVRNGKYTTTNPYMNLVVGDALIIP
jgi:hypothetical protein